ncbi:unnamed protein product, partial [Tuber aestivum]
MTKEGCHLAKRADHLILNRKNIRTKGPMRTLDHRMFVPFVIKRKVGNRAYELQLPARWAIHPVFNVGLLEPDREGVSRKRIKEVPIPQRVDNEGSYIIEAVVDSRW